MEVPSQKADLPRNISGNSLVSGILSKNVYSWRDQRSRHRRFYSSPHGPGGERTLPTSRRRSQQVARDLYRTLEFLRPSRERIETKEFYMRKSITNSDTELSPEKPSWLDVSTIAKVEVTSEDAQLPIEGAFGRRQAWMAGFRARKAEHSAYLR